MHDISYEMLISVESTWQLIEKMLLSLCKANITLNKSFQRIGLKLYCGEEFIGICSALIFPDNEKASLIFAVHPSIKNEAFELITSYCKSVNIDYNEKSGLYNRFEFSGNEIFKIVNKILPSDPTSQISILADVLRKESLLKDDEFITAFECLEEKSTLKPANRRFRKDEVSIHCKADDRIIDSLFSRKLLFLKKSSLHNSNLKLNNLGTFELWVPKGQAIHIWRKFIYSGKVFPISLSDRLNIFESRYNANSSNESLLLYGIPYFIVGSLGFKRCLNVFINEFEEKESKLPPGKKRLYLKESQELFKQFKGHIYSEEANLVRLNYMQKGRPFLVNFIYQFQAQKTTLQIYRDLTEIMIKGSVYDTSIMENMFVRIGTTVHNRLLDIKCKSGFNRKIGKSSVLASITPIDNQQFLNGWKNALDLHKQVESELETTLLSPVRTLVDELLQCKRQLFFIQHINTPFLLYPVELAK